MASEKRKKDTLEARNDGAAEHPPKVALDEEVDAREAIIDGLAARTKNVRELHAKQEHLVRLCADALHAGLHILRPRERDIIEGVEVGLDLALRKDVAIHFQRIWRSSHNGQ